MADTYGKLYSRLVGEVDDALQMIANGYGREGYGKDQLVIDVGEKLKNALLEAEDEFISVREFSDDEEDEQEEEDGADYKQVYGAVEEGIKALRREVMKELGRQYQKDRLGEPFLYYFMDSLSGILDMAEVIRHDTRGEKAEVPAAAPPPAAE